MLGESMPPSIVRSVNGNHPTPKLGTTESRHRHRPKMLLLRARVLLIVLVSQLELDLAVQAVTGGPSKESILYQLVGPLARARTHTYICTRIYTGTLTPHKRTQEGPMPDPPRQREL